MGPNQGTGGGRDADAGPGCTRSHERRRQQDMNPKHKQNKGLVVQSHDAVEGEHGRVSCESLAYTVRMPDRALRGRANSRNGGETKSVLFLEWTNLI